MSTTVQPANNTAPALRVRLRGIAGHQLTATCPTWCTDDHAEDVAHGVHAEDFAHRGEESALMVPSSFGTNDEQLLVQIHQYPFGRDLREPTAVLWPTLGTGENHLGPNGLIDLAEQLRKYADELEHIAAQVHDARKEHADTNASEGWGTSKGDAR
ncbi:hypothetical protein ABZ883_03295 [Streptomyces sp. NPDC046977]|uniref:DUF6907 domain-containing protein n=1 Tax=Streptomyces sp. NPDC046977 TaxID=3154703 RepID=UPI0033DC6491